MYDSTFISESPNASRMQHHPQDAASSIAKSLNKVGSQLRGSYITIGDEKKLSLSKPDRDPPLPEKIDVVNSWFASCTKGKRD